MCWTCFLSSSSLFGEPQPAEQEASSPAWVSARKRRTPRSCLTPSRGSSAAERLSHNLTRQRPANMSANYRRAGRDFWLNYKEFLLIEIDFIWYDLKYKRWETFEKPYRAPSLPSASLCDAWWCCLWVASGFPEEENKRVQTTHVTSIPWLKRAAPDRHVNILYNPSTCW